MKISFDRFLGDPEEFLLDPLNPEDETDWLSRNDGK
jgi:hypothetical protein